MRAKPTRKRPVPTERAEQQLVVSWARGVASRYDERAALLYAVANALGGKRQPEAGILPGVPDLCLPVPMLTEDGQKGALYIEMKRERGGRLSWDQQDMIARLRKAGNAVAVAKGARAGCDAIASYLGLPERAVRGI